MKGEMGDEMREWGKGKKEGEMNELNVDGMLNDREKRRKRKK